MALNLIISRRAGDDVDLFYHVPGNAINEPFCYHLTRTVAGLSFPQRAGKGEHTSYGYACLVGERTFYAEDGDRTTRQFVVLDEIEASSQAALYKLLIEYKDRYLAGAVVCPDRPQPMVDNLRDMEGLSKYANESPVFLRARHPSYVSRDTVATVAPHDVPPTPQVVQFFETLLGTELQQPDTLWPLMGRTGQQSYRLALPGNLSNEKARTGIQSPSVYPKVVEALYVALHYLETTARVHYDGSKWEHKGSVVTGY
uniref:Uncharacterized protein n=1 Tax=viral metagenome TaxID=1070528 RepID=A0A6M3LDT3_9ZZZZ